MILAFAHPALVVSDLEAARIFYEKMFGFRVIREEGWSDNPDIDRAVGSRGSACKGFTMAGHNCCIELFEFSAPEKRGPDPETLGPHEYGIRHLAFFVDDCDHELERLISLGGKRLGETADIGGGIHTVFCRDPFGNILELCEVAVPEEYPTNLPGINKLDNFTGA